MTGSSLARRSSIDVSLSVFTVFLVENGVDKAAGESFQALARNDERLFRLCLNENLGSAGGFSEGIKAVTSNMPDGHVLVLDDDNLPAKICSLLCRIRTQN